MPHIISQITNQILPIEVKANENLNAKSLKIFVATNTLNYGIRTSMSYKGYKLGKNVITLRHYFFL